MIPRQWILSALIVWHVTAVLIRALPDPGQLPGFAPSQPTEGWRGVVTTGLDAVGLAVVPVTRSLADAVRTIRPPVDAYIRLTGVSQAWGMFSNPPRVDQYLRVRYYVRPHEGRPWMATQLVWPAHREYQVRLLQSFRDSYLDKAFSVATDLFHQRRKPAQLRPDTRPEELPDDLAPIARYYSRIFAQRLPPGERIVRTEVWTGEAPNTPPGRERDEQALNRRRAVLQAYYEGVVEERFRVRPYPPYHGGEREADIYWLLEYFEES